MLAAIPLFGSRVSPRCLFSETMIVVQVEEGKIVSRRKHSIKGFSQDTLFDELVELGVDTLVCGGVDQVFIEDAEMCGIRIISNVAGELKTVLEALEAGGLVPGFGLSRKRDLPAPPAEDREKKGVDCLQCSERDCLEGKPCPLAPVPEARFYESAERRLAEVAAEVSSENEPKLCRVAELVHFAQNMGYRRLGVAFCVELFQEAEILCGLLRRFFEVVPVCCRIGVNSKEGSNQEELHLPLCNVLGQAEVLNQSRTDLNLMVGLCVGGDILFTERSHAPTTTLFVKDMSLANNPVSALYSRSYLQEMVETMGTKNWKGER